MTKLLIVDDDMYLRRLVRTYALESRFECDEVADGMAALEMVRTRGYDLIVLDVMMPGLDGFDTLAEIRKHTQTPVIMLTARDEEYDKLTGFKLGADDYVPKPFNPKELMARVTAVLKRSGGEAVSPTLRFGDLSIHPELRRVALNDDVISLTPKEYDLLLVLARNNRIVMTRDQLLEKVWGYNYFGDARTVDTHVKSLREHLGDRRTMIQTVWGVGYKFEYDE